MIAYFRRADSDSCECREKISGDTSSFGVVPDDLYLICACGIVDFPWI
jgi:hypothetical protein